MFIEHADALRDRKPPLYTEFRRRTLTTNSVRTSFNWAAAMTLWWSDLAASRITAVSRIPGTRRH